VFDIDDATKVRIEETRILALGKTLNPFNAVDCGIFKLGPDFFQGALGQASEGKESLSEFLQPLIDNGKLIPVFIPEGSTWIDIDTPDAYQHALMLREKLIS